MYFHHIWNVCPACNRNDLYDKEAGFLQSYLSGYRQKNVSWDLEFKYFEKSGHKLFA